MYKKTVFSLLLLFVFVLTFSFIFTVNVMATLSYDYCCEIPATNECTAGIGVEADHDHDIHTAPTCKYNLEFEDLCVSQFARICW